MLIQYTTEMFNYAVCVYIQERAAGENVSFSPRDKGSP
jgi:hypothetical protein